MLKEVGFWCDLERKLSTGGDADDRLDPRELVDDAWIKGNPEIVNKLYWYLTSGAFVESYELGYSFCRFSECVESQDDPKVMGACTMTDGTYCWPEGLWHYIKCHHVRPPTDFQRHVDKNYSKLQQMRADMDESHLYLWDDMECAPVPMPRMMEKWILTNTTITASTSTRTKEDNCRVA